MKTANKSAEEQKVLVPEPAIIDPKSRGNGATALPANSDLYIAATELPNLDGRSSVLTALPQDLFMPDREDFAVAETARPAGVTFGHPKDWAMVHPDPVCYRVMLCIKDAKNRKVLPITQSLVRKHPRLQTACRPHVVRQAITLDGPYFLWPAPWPGGREYPGDEKHREAQQSARKDWVKMVWADSDWEVYDTEPPNIYDHPDWGTAEDFEAFLTRGIAPILLSTGDEPFLRRFLGRGR